MRGCARKGCTMPTETLAAENSVILGVGPYTLATPAAAVREMFVLPRVSRPPGLREHWRGVLRLRERVLEVLDTRERLGLARASAEVDALVELLHAREQDHRKWLAELGASVRENRPFQLALDPRMCAFGKWYYAYRAPTAVLRGQLERFEGPHAEIHALAGTVSTLRAEGRDADALTLIRRAEEGTLAQLVQLFEATRALVRSEHREIAVVLEHRGATSVMAVDSAEAVTRLEPFAAGEDPLAALPIDRRLFTGVARWRERAAPVFVVDLDRMLE
jgi:purine-binding chemotaxis protein CheW